MIAEWIEFKIDEASDYIPMQRWSIDHWQTLAYLETRAVDAHGVIDNKRMRCNPRLHREFYYLNEFHIPQGKEYPTRLKGEEIYGHDDWSCLEDFVAAGLLRAWWSVIKSDSIFGQNIAKIEMSDSGLALAAALRQHRALGGAYHTFEIDFVEVGHE